MVNSIKEIAIKGRINSLSSDLKLKLLRVNWQDCCAPFMEGYSEAPSFNQFTDMSSGYSGLKQCRPDDPRGVNAKAEVAVCRSHIAKERQLH